MRRHAVNETTGQKEGKGLAIKQIHEIPKACAWRAWQCDECWNIWLTHDEKPEKCPRCHLNQLVSDHFPDQPVPDGDLCPLCKSKLSYCPQGCYCSSESCRYAY